ncbi:hypothetical protein BCR41DRAFT_342728 [Lobosporangium transversale]|uniref:Phosphatidylcholine transfer protein n=1 Tax=Lobosporangium transversale TaxID=64571 RepID=A0A1Y2G752_9FUNG|nr:hypothetical protein BCR41DRAFT_342728 [Lobosporangium transversale]ORY99664.1 hypothetical protein BCR41DRAFT_342728 [Lobosporangium transversale]|eukprot:XP_021875928.1 hypothetical protein BCR41DRAFT_342728 [Lobosporangium transversale]
MFTEEQVNTALLELKDPDVASWELFTEASNFKVFRRTVAKSALKEYKVLGTYPDLPVRYLLRAYTDLEHRKSWDKNMANWKQLDANRLHFTSKFPWPLSPRDYVYELGIQEYGNGVVCINGKSVEDPAMPEKPGTVRVDEYRQDVVIQPTEDGRGCRIWFAYFDNPKGNIPSSIVNWAAKSGVPSFLNALRNAGHSLMKQDAETGRSEKTQPLSALETPSIGVDC